MIHFSMFACYIMSCPDWVVLLANGFTYLGLCMRTLRMHEIASLVSVMAFEKAYASRWGEINP